MYQIGAPRRFKPVWMSLINSTVCKHHLQITTGQCQFLRWSVTSVYMPVASSKISISKYPPGRCYYTHRVGLQWYLVTIQVKSCNLSKGRKKRRPKNINSSSKNSHRCSASGKSPLSSEPSGIKSAAASMWRTSAAPSCGKGELLQQQFHSDFR